MPTIYADDAGNSRISLNGIFMLIPAVIGQHLVFKTDSAR